MNKFIVIYSNHAFRFIDATTVQEAIIKQFQWSFSADITVEKFSELINNCTHQGNYIKNMVNLYNEHVCDEQLHFIGTINRVYYP